MKGQVKTVLIKTMGSSEIGTGHIYRSLALSKELEKDFRVIFHVNDSPQVEVLMQEQGASYFLDADLESLVTREHADLFLLDQLGRDDEILQELKTQFPHLKTIALDYFDYENEFIDVIINLFNHNLEKPRPDRDNVQYYEGLEYAIIKDEFQSYVSDNKEISPEVRKVLVTFGGVDKRGNTERVLQLLETAEIRDVEVDVVFGPLSKGEIPKDLTFSIRIHQSIPASLMVKLMTEADLAFCGSGTTMMELLSVGTPSVVLPQNLFEERFALGVEGREAIKVIKDNPQEGDVEYIRHLFASPRERERLSQRGKLLIDGKGKERIYRIIDGVLT